MRGSSGTNFISNDSCAELAQDATQLEALLFAREYLYTLFHKLFGVLNNPMATLTMEGMVAGLLAIVALVDLILGYTKKTENRVVRIIGAIVGVVLMCIVTMAYATSYGNPAWTAAPTFPLFVVGDLAAGAGLWTLFNKATAGDKRFAYAACAVAVLFAVVLVWQAAVFAGTGQGIAQLVIGAIAAVAAGAVAYFVLQVKLSNAGTIFLVLAVIALCVSRYGFYMASVI